MSTRDYERGVHDKWVFGTLLFSNSKAEIEGRKDYDRRDRHGRNSR